MIETLFDNCGRGKSNGYNPLPLILYLCAFLNIQMRFVLCFPESYFYLICYPLFQISDREHSLQDSSGIFWDNDSLAALLALELKADLLLLLSDVDGLYSGPPSDPHSKLIYTYIKEIHQSEITFGDKSRVGRGGMTAKVKAAVNAAYAGIPVVITRYTFMLIYAYIILCGAI